MKVKIEVRLKPAILDPQGKTGLGALKQLGYDEVAAVRVGKLIELELGDGTPEVLKARVEELSRRLLANPLMETFDIHFDDAGA